MSDSYGFGADSKYCHPGSNVLINKLGIVDAKELEKSERQITTFKLTRVSNNPPAASSTWIISSCCTN